MDRVEFCLATGHQTTIPGKQLLMFVAILRVDGVVYRRGIVHSRDTHLFPDLNVCCVFDSAITTSG
jgi:hypothetical protein